MNKPNPKSRCCETCGKIHPNREWRTAWSHATKDGRVIRICDADYNLIELRSFPTRAGLWDFVANLPDDLRAVVPPPPAA